MNPEPNVEVVVSSPETSVVGAHGQIVGRPMARLGGGLCWSLLVAEMAADGGSETGGNAPNPWTPDDPKEAA